MGCWIDILCHIYLKVWTDVSFLFDQMLVVQIYEGSLEFFNLFLGWIFYSWFFHHLVLHDSQKLDAVVVVAKRMSLKFKQAMIFDMVQDSKMEKTPYKDRNNLKTNLIHNTLFLLCVQYFKELCPMQE